MPLEIGGGKVDYRSAAKRRRKKKKREPVYRSSDSGEAARFLAAERKRRRSRPSRGADTAEAARGREMDARTRLETRRANRDVGGRVLNRKDVGAFLASLRERREKGEESRARIEKLAPGQKLTEKEREENRRQILASKALQKLGPDVERSAFTAPSATRSGEEILGPGLGPLLPIKGGTPASEADLKWLAADVAGLFPVFRGPRAAATAAKQVKAAGRVSGVAAPTSKAARQYREPVIRPLVRRARGKPEPGKPHKPRFLRIGEREQQIPKARSRITRTLIERPADVASRAIDRPSVRGVPVLGRATASMRAAKAAGREEAQEGIRAGAAMGQHLKALKTGPLAKGKGTELAHTWWAQMPKSHRNAQGLKLVRAKQAEELEEITSGRALQGVERRQASVRAQAAAAREAGDTERVFDLMRDAEELKVLASDLPERAKDISRSLAALDRVIAKPPKLDPAKIDALDALSKSRKATLIAEGVLDPARAAEREGLVSRWLGLEPTGEEIFFGHRLGKVSGANPSLLPRSIGTGKAKLPQGVSQANKLVLARTGRTMQTFETAARDWQSAQVFESTRRVRSVLGQMGEPFAGRVPKDYLLVNLRGRAVPKQWKAVEELGEDLPEDEVRRAAQEILSESFAQSGKQAEEMLEAAKKAGVGWDELRVVHKDIAERFFSQFTPAVRGGQAMTAYDRLVDITAASLIFARLGYIPKNIVQNVIMAVPHQGAYLLHNAVRAGQVLRDPQLAPLLRGEVGFSGATRALGKEARTQKVVGKVIGTVGGIADDPARISAFLHEAAAAGVISRATPWLTRADRANLLRLFTDKTQRPLLNDIRSRGVEAMADFSRMTPTQRKQARRLLIIPGWLMAGSRYPFHFAATHPVRSALLAYVAMGEPGAPERLQLNPPIDQLFAKNLPHWAEGIETPWGVERTTSLSPVNTPWDVANALAQRSPETAGGFANPLAASVWNVANRQVSGPQGSYRTSFQESLQRNAERLIPNIDLARDLASPEASKYYPEDATRLGRLKREVGILPIQMTRELSPAQSATRSAAETVARERASFFEAVRKFAPDQLHGGRLGPKLRESFSRKAQVERERARVTADTDPGVDRELAKFEAEVKLLGKWGIVPSSKVGTALRWAQTASAEEVESYRRGRVRQLLTDAYLARILEARQFLQEQGADL